MEKTTTNIGLQDFMVIRDEVKDMQHTIRNIAQNLFHLDYDIRADRVEHRAVTPNADEILLASRQLLKVYTSSLEMSHLIDSM